MPERREIGHAEARALVAMVGDRLAAQGDGAAVAVVDAHGELVAFLRTDGCGLASINIAIHKAFTAARERVESSVLGERSRTEGFPITNFGDPRYVGWGGGVPIVVAGVRHRRHRREWPAGGRRYRAGPLGGSESRRHLILPASRSRLVGWAVGSVQPRVDPAELAGLRLRGRERMPGGAALELSQVLPGQLGEADDVPKLVHQSRVEDRPEGPSREGRAFRIATQRAPTPQAGTATVASASALKSSSMWRPCRSK